MISRFISIVKGVEYKVDDRVPNLYLFRVMFYKFIHLLFGLLLFRFKARVFAHSSSKIYCVSKIISGKNLVIDRNVYIDALSKDGIIFGKNVSIGKYSCIECTGSLRGIGKGLVVGDNVGLGSHGFFGCAGGVYIGSDTIFGNFVSIHSENHNYSDLTLPIRKQGVNHKGIVIGENCWIGAKVTILDGAEIGSGSIIAAGAVVKGKFPDNCILGGIPAKILKRR